MTKPSLAKPKAREESWVTTWGPYQSLTVTFAIYFFTMFLASLMLLVVLALLGIKSDQAQKISQESVILQFVLTAGIEALTIGFLWLFLRSRKAGFKNIGLFRRPRWSDLGYSAVGYGLYFPLSLMAIALASTVIPAIDLDQPQQIGFENATSVTALALAFVSLVILPPIVEEIMCRGFLYQGLKSRWPKVVAVLVTSLVFGAAHLQIGSGEPLLWVAAIDTFMASLVLILLRDVTGSLWSSIGMHMIKNGVAYATLFIFMK